MISKEAKINLLALCVVTSLFFFISCIDPYKVEVEGSKSYLIVDGTITNTEERPIISIFETNETSNFKSSQFTSTISPKPNDIRPVSKAKVKVIENDNKTFDLVEIEPGYYQMPLDFVGKIGNTYKLVFENAKGSVFESSNERMSTVSTIDKIYDTFNSTGIKDKLADGGKIPTNDVFIDFEDPANEKNFYRWKWTSFEIQNICETCKQGRYFRSQSNLGPSGECKPDQNLESNAFFDYECDSFCWDIFLGVNLDIFSDIYTNGLPQKNKLVAQVPLFQSNPCLVVVEQFSLNPNAYRYLKLLQDQSINTGTLADTPPAPIKGNIINKNDPSQLILGYFTASAKEEIRYMMGRKNTRGAQPNGIFRYKNKRDYILEAPSIMRPSIPLAICKSSLFRTPNSPKGWQFGIR
jgi:hypothetical protein